MEPTNSEISNGARNMMRHQASRGERATYPCACGRQIKPQYNMCYQCLLSKRAKKNIRQDLGFKRGNLNMRAIS